MECQSIMKSATVPFQAKHLSLTAHGVLSTNKDPHTHTYRDRGILHRQNHIRKIIQMTYIFWSFSLPTLAETSLGLENEICR